MGYSIGDGLVTIALAAGFVGYWIVERRYRTRRLEMLHEERLRAMERGIPLIEVGEDFPAERKLPDRTTLPLIGISLLTFAAGAMVMMAIMLPPDRRAYAVAPLPVALMGLGLAWFHFVFERPRL